MLNTTPKKNGGKTMAHKQRKLTTLAYGENGEELVFNSTLFKETIDEHAKRYNQINSINRGGKTAIRKMLADAINPGSLQVRDNVRKWYNGSNGPSCIEDVQKLEGVLGCSLLIPRPGMELLKNDRNPNSLTSIDPRENMSSHPVEQTMYVLSEAKHDSARKVYGVVCDLIRAHQKLLNNYWDAGFPLVADPCVPADFPAYSDVQNDIRKYGVGLPRDLIEKIMLFVRDIYGSWDISLEEAVADLDINEYRKRFDCWLGRVASQDDFCEWCEFLNEHTLDNYEILDEIFDEYMY
jgi:hypothetical protein